MEKARAKVYRIACSFQYDVEDEIDAYSEREARKFAREILLESVRDTLQCGMEDAYIDIQVIEQEGGYNKK